MNSMFQVLNSALSIENNLQAARYPEIIQRHNATEVDPGACSPPQEDFFGGGSS